MQAFARGSCGTVASCMLQVQMFFLHRMRNILASGEEIHCLLRVPLQRMIVGRLAESRGAIGSRPGFAKFGT